MKIKRLLCVDDDKITLTLIKLVVEKTFFAQEISTRMNGKEALEFYHDLLHHNTADQAPELIFLDLNMPIMNGWDFLDEFSNRYYHIFPNTRVVILSSSTDQAERDRARKYPMIIDYVTKPLTMASLSNLNL
ncbi:MULTISPECIES: response regulator [Emticicia]|uniref:response regulator n=1 Tax=Emticicia TaxID=312278 RepID=UPI0020A103BE|nr:MULTISPECIES: response regulator [Emticicia]UTA66548.1 response regulator [Emticicia sp. 21SJ11W-3]